MQGPKPSACVYVHAHVHVWDLDGPMFVFLLQLFFVSLVCSQLIKRRIEHLIEREYLERDTADPNLYRYLA